MFGDRLQTWKRSSHFQLAFFVLPKEQRRALTAVYAFSRAVDDAVDSEGTIDIKKNRLKEWRVCLDQAYAISSAGVGVHQSLLSELARAVERYSIPKQYFLDLLTGVEQDLTVTRYATFKDLERYCYYVAGTIGLICNAIFGERTERHAKYAVMLGTAFQLTNIIRDVKQDREGGRIYLPQEDLERFGVSEAELTAGHTNEKRISLMRFQAARARGYFERAWNLMADLGGRGPLAAEIMTAIYFRLLTEIERRGFDIHQDPIRLSMALRIRLALGVWLQSKLQSSAK